MLQIFRTVACIVALTSGAMAQPLFQEVNPNDELEVRLQAVQSAARTNQLTAERVLYAADQALNQAAIIKSSVKNNRLVHLELKRLAAEVPGTRAIIAIDAYGTLIHDSYTYPANKHNLSDRTYFKEAARKPGMHIGEQVVGRSSGAAFIPLAQRFGDVTFVAIVAPYALVDVQPDCGDCWSLAIQNDGDLITIFPPEKTVNPGLLKLVAESSKKIGHTITRYENSVVAVAWRKSADYSVISASVRGLPDTAAVEIDLN